MSDEVGTAHLRAWYVVFYGSFGATGRHPGKVEVPDYVRAAGIAEAVLEEIVPLGHTGEDCTVTLRVMTPQWAADWTPDSANGLEGVLEFAVARCRAALALTALGTRGRIPEGHWRHGAHWWGGNPDSAPNSDAPEPFPRRGGRGVTLHTQRLPDGWWEWRCCLCGDGDASADEDDVMQMEREHARLHHPEWAVQGQSDPMWWIR